MKLMLLFGILFVISMQPMFMVSSLIFITFMYSLYIFKSVGTFWFSYLLLMVMLSGVLVVFTYMVTLIPNETFEVYGLIIVFFFMIFMMLEFNNKMSYLLDMSMMSLNLWITYLGMFNLFLISFLLVVMLLVVFLSNMNYGSFRVN